MSVPEVVESRPPPAPRSRWRKRLLLALSLFLLLCLLVAGLYGYVSLQAHWRLQEAIAEADRLDPGWRIEDLDAKQPAVPDAENAALRVTAAVRGQQGPALDEARRLADTPRGRLPIPRDPRWFEAVLAHVQQTREVTALLKTDALQRAQAGDLDGALANCRGKLHAGRSAAGEPTIIGLLVCFAVQAVAFEQIERVLALGEASEAALAALQRTLEEEDAEPVLLNVLRGERALAALPPGQLGLAQQALPPVGTFTQNPTAWLNQFWQALGLRARLSDRGASIQIFNGLVERIKDCPPGEAERVFLKEVQASEARLKADPSAASSSPLGLWLPGLMKSNEAGRRRRASLRCCLVLVAAERYRRGQGRWPGSPEALVPAYLRNVPTDPYDGKPIRLRRVPNGLVIYSPGTDGVDDGGTLGPPFMQGKDLGYTLWDISQRRQAKPDTPSPGAAAEGPAAVVPK